jgi:hypothetical protein
MSKPTCWTGCREHLSVSPYCLVAQGRAVSGKDGKSAIVSNGGREGGGPGLADEWKA